MPFYLGLTRDGGTERLVTLDDWRQLVDVLMADELTYFVVLGGEVGKVRDAMLDGANVVNFRYAGGTGRVVRVPTANWSVDLDFT